MLLHKQFAEIKTSKQVEECKALPERDYSQRKTAERIPAPIKQRQTDPGLQGDRRGAEQPGLRGNIRKWREAGAG